VKIKIVPKGEKIVKMSRSLNTPQFIIIYLIFLSKIAGEQQEYRFRHNRISPFYDIRHRLSPQKIDLQKHEYKLDSRVDKSNYKIGPEKIALHKHKYKIETEKIGFQNVKGNEKIGSRFPILDRIFNSIPVVNPKKSEIEKSMEGGGSEIDIAVGDELPEDDFVYATTLKTVSLTFSDFIVAIFLFCGYC